MALRRGPLSLKLVLDRESGRRAARGLNRAVGAEASRLTDFLSNAAVKFISGLERGLGHEALAALWAHTPTVSQGAGGAYSAEVYSRAEDMTFHDRNNAQDGAPYDTDYPVQGKDLVAWLEYGVSSHEIRPRQEGGYLSFPVAKGVSASDFVGTAFTEGGVVGGSFAGPAPDAMLLVDEVEHPGFAGNHNLRATATFLENEAKRQGEAAARRIATAFAASQGA